MSVDDYVGAADASGSPMSFYDASWVDIRSQAKYITLSSNTPTITSLWAYWTYSDVQSLVQTALTEQAICTYSWNVFSWSGNIVKTTSTNIANSFTYNGIGAIIKTNGKIDTWTLSNSTSEKDTGITTGWYTANYADIWVSVPQKLPYIIDSGYLYVWVNNKIYKLDLTTAGFPVTTALTLDVWFIIKGITQIGDRFFIYSSDWVMGIQYMWTGSSTLTGGNLTKIRWYSRPIVNVANINNVDYLVIGDTIRRSFYRVNGYQQELLYQSKRSVNDKDTKFMFLPDFTNAIETVNNVIYMSSDWCIHSWWHQNPGMPDSMVREFTFQSAAGSPATVVQSSPDNTQLYLFYKDTSNNIVRAQYQISTPAYSLDPGTLIFNPILWGLYSSEDNGLKVRIGYDLATSTVINVYKQDNSEGGYANFYCDSLTSPTFPVVGDTYTFSGTTYTVYAVTTSVGSAYAIIHCTLTPVNVDLKDINKRSSSGTMTRTSGTWPATFTFYRRTMGMYLIWTVDVTSTHKQLFDLRDPCFQKTFMLDLITYDSANTPKVWDVVSAYQEIENDI